MNQHNIVQRQQRSQKAKTNQHYQFSQSSDVTASYQEAVSADNSSQTMPFQASHVQFKSLGSIEEESPRWTHPPEPQTNTGRAGEMIFTPASGTIDSNQEVVLHQNYLHFFGDRTSDGDGQSSNSLQQHSHTTAAMPRESHAANNIAHERHVRSQPTLLQAMDSNRQDFQSNQLMHIQQHYRIESDQQVLQPYNQRMQLVGLGSLISNEQRAGAESSNRQVGFSSPAYRIADSQMQIFSGRNTRIGTNTHLFTSFIDKLYTREKVSEIADELKSLESIFLAQVASETPDLYRQIIEEQKQSSFEDKNDAKGSKTHIAVMNATLEQAQKLRKSFKQFQIHRSEVQSFNQLVEGIQMVDSHDQHNATGTLGNAGVRLHSVESLPERVHTPGNAYVVNNESTINRIKMGTQASEHQKTGSSHRNAEDSQEENFMVQIMRQQEDEISKCNSLIDKLKSESADLELTIVDQRSEIQNLCNKLKQSHLRYQAEEPSASQVKFEKREMENLIMRLKDEIRVGHEEGQSLKQENQEMNNVILNLKGQVTSLKHKLVLSEDGSKNMLSHEMQDQLKEIADLRTQNQMINQKYQEMVQNVNKKEDEILELEEKSKQMLVEAQKDAHDCIKYFKNLAFQTQKERGGGQPAARSQSPIERRRLVQQQKSSPLMKMIDQESANETKSFPKSLGPIAQSKRNQSQSMAFKPRNKEYNLNGVRLRLNARAQSTIESVKSQKDKQVKGNRASTMSPMSYQRTPYNDAVDQTISQKSGGRRQQRGTSQDRGGNNSSASAKSLKFQTKSYGNEPAVIEDQDLQLASSKIFEVEAKLECTMNSLVDAFAEISESKQCISKLVSNYGEQYCFQLQKFSVLAYDYLERIDNMFKREGQIQEKLSEQAKLVQKLKGVTSLQREHIEAQNSFILQQKNQLTLQTVSYERVNCKQDEDVDALHSLIQTEFPLLRDTIMASHVSLLQTKKINETDNQQLSDVRNHHDLSKKKVKILEEELEKSLQTSFMLEETIQANRKKFNQLVDLIKDIWQEEVQNTTSAASNNGGPMNATISQYGGNTINQPHTHNLFQNQNGNHGSTTAATGRGATAGLQPVIDTISDMNQTLLSANNANTNAAKTDVPMPISWLSDISEHIKTLKEMNDFQTDEVFQMVNMLHSSESKKRAESNDGMNQWATHNNADSNSTEEDEKPSCQESGISQTYQPPDEGTTLRDDDQVLVEESDTERGLDHYNERARRIHKTASINHDYHQQDNRDIGEADDMYINTTSVSKSKSKSKAQADYVFASHSDQMEDKKEMSFSQRLDDDTLDMHQRFGATGFNGQERSVIPSNDATQRPSSHTNKRVFSHSHTGRQNMMQITSAKTANNRDRANGPGVPSRRDRSHPSRNYDWPDGNLFAGPRVVETQRVGLDQQRRSLHVTSNRWQEVLFSDGNTQQMRQGSNIKQQRMMNNSSFAALQPISKGSNNPMLPTSMHGKNYRASIDVTASVVGNMAVDSGNKRNELYAMLREEVLGHIKQKEVSKDTIMGMKAQLKGKRNELNAANRAYQVIYDEKESSLETNKLLENEIKDLELQIEEMQGVVQDREASMENLKMQIEDFEKELLGLQDQMTHVMKLNQEIGMASEHWERSYHQLQQESLRDKEQQNEEFQRQAQKKLDKIQQYKRKLQEKERVLKTMQQELVTATTYRDETENRRSGMVSVSIMTDPALELLEKHKSALESKLGQVKQDVSAVLDQVEKEQIEKGKIGDLLLEQKETNKTLVLELNDTKRELSDTKRELEGVRNEIQTLQARLQESSDEVQQMNEVIEQDQQHFQEQIDEAEKINSSLQQQVEEVTNTAKELQEQMACHYQTNDGLAHNAVIQEQKINQLEDQLVYYQKQLKQKNRAIAGLEQKIILSKQQMRQSKRETRSVSIPRITTKNSTANVDPVTGASCQMNNYSQIMQEPHPMMNNRNNSSSANSRESSFLIGAGDTQVEAGKINPYYLGNNNETMQTSQQSIFDEAVADSATFQRPQVDDFNPAHHQQQTSYTRNRPPRRSHKKTSSRKAAGSNSRAVTPKTPGCVTQNTSVHMKGHQNRNNSYLQNEETQGALDISPLAPLGKTHVAGISMGVSQLTQCCCSTPNCMNMNGSSPNRNLNQTRLSQKKTCEGSVNGTGKMTAIDDLQSSYKQFKIKQEATKETKRKVKKTLKMTETIVRYYLNEAQLKAEMRTEQALQKLQQNSKQAAEQSNLAELRKHVSEWSAQFSLDNKVVTEEEGLEAKTYFKKRNPTVINCLRALVDHISHQKSDQEFLISGTNTNSEYPHEHVIKSNNKEPPQIVSNRGLLNIQSRDQLDTEYSDQQYDVNTSRRFSDAQKNYGTLQNSSNRESVNLIIQDNSKSVRSPANVPGIQSQRNGVMTMGLTSLKSPASSCRNCTATFHQTQSVANDLVGHCKTLFQKFLQTGRSLAGICYGGCIFMGEGIKQVQRQKVDYALSFLAKDSSEFEGTNGQSMDELWTVVDGLLTCLSQIISGSCQHYLKANQPMDQKQQQQAFESIAQKSIELSMDQNHMISRMERASFDGTESAKKSTDYPLPPNNSASHAQSQTSQQINSRLQDLEQRIKQKFSNIKSLETLLDTILGKQKDLPALIPQLLNDLQGLQKVFLNIRRVVSKLKIELHQDYLHVSQILLHFQTSKDHNTSMTTTLDMPLVTQTQHSNTLQPVSQNQNNYHRVSDNHTISTQLVNNQMPQSRLQMQIGSGVLQIGQQQTTTREPTSTSSAGVGPANTMLNSIQQRGYSISSHQQPMLSTLGLGPAFNQQQQLLNNHQGPASQSSMRHQHQQFSVGKNSTSNCATSVPGGLPSAHGGQGGANMSSARFSSNSIGMSTARNDPRSIDKIVEELQGLTFEYSQATNLQPTSGHPSHQHSMSNVGSNI